MPPPARTDSHPQGDRILRLAASHDADTLATAKIDRATLRRAWGFARPYRRHLIGFLGTIAASSLVAVLPPLVFRRLIDHLAANGARGDLGLVNLLFVAAVALALTETVLRLANRWFSARIGEGLIYDLRVALYDHIQRMPMAFFTRVQTGAVMSRLTTDVVGAQATVTTMATVTSATFLLCSVLVVMLSLSWQVTLAALLILPFVVALDRNLSPRIVAISRERMQLNAAMGGMATERLGVSGALLVKLFGRRRQEHQDFDTHATAVRDTGVRQAMVSRTYYAGLALVGAVGTAAVYWVGGRAVINGTLTLGTLVALATYVNRLYSPLTDLAGARVDLLTALLSFERCFEVLDAPVPIDDAPDAIELPAPVTGRVELADVHFQFPAGSTVSVPSLERDGAPPSDEPSDWILRGVSFVCEPGTVTAIVGPSGAGKTTLTGLLPRLYDVTEGAVRIDGHDVRRVTLDSLSKAIGVVTQDPYLFHDTIANNLRYARPDATLDDVIDACRQARIHDTIAALPEGYDTVVGERGYRMSGGEKQRLAIARVLLKAPAIVVLDEATAHLDSENEAHVQRALAAALEGRTSLVIAHRLSTIRSADTILVLDAGVIVQRGTHDELLAEGGLYAELHATQYALTPD